jgi:hypothetical protein
MNQWIRTWHAIKKNREFERWTREVDERKRRDNDPTH